MPIVGRARIAKFLLGLRKHQHPDARHEVRMLNGLPSLVIEQPSHGGMAPRIVMQCELDADGLVRAVYAVLATPKLTALRPLGGASAKA